MNKHTVPELLANVLETYCHTETGSDSVIRMRDFLNHPRFPGRNEQFKQELAESILYHTISPKEYERLTDAAYDEQESIDRELRELWQHLYGDEPVMLRTSDATAIR